MKILFPSATVTAIVRFHLVWTLFLLVSSLILLAPSVILGQVYDGLEKPMENRFLDLTEAIDPAASQAIVDLCEEISDNFSGEVIVVAAHTTGGVPPRRYATELFNAWGVGSRWRGNGILVFAAFHDRVVEIILGDGEDLDKDVDHAEVIVDRFMLPNFRKPDYGAGLYEGTRACAARIFGMADLKSKVDLPPLSERAPNFRPKLRSDNNTTIGNQAPRPRLRARQPQSPLPWLIGIGGLAGIGLLVGGRYWLRYRQRYCEDCQGSLILLSEDEDDQFLRRPEVLEEQLGSVDYDVWACSHCETVEKYRYGALLTQYSKCPDCRYRTKLTITRTLVAATTEHGGRVHVTESCKNCNYQDTYTYSTPRKSKPSNSNSSHSSSSGSWGGGSWGNSGSGGSGSRPTGGSSSGRGASGRW